METKFSASGLHTRLEERFSGDGWIYLREVPDGTTVNATRRADAMAMGLWKTTGIHLHGFELKVSRSDWRSEMQDLLKSDTFISKCHFWWLVAPKEVAKLEEIPANWGWLAPTSDGKTLRVQKQPTKNQPSLSYEFLAAILRSARKSNTEEAEIKRQVEAAYRKGRQDAHDHLTAGSRRLESGYKQKLEQMIDFLGHVEKATGLDLRRYQTMPERLGKVVKLVLACQDLERFEKHLINTLETHLNRVEILLNDHRSDTLQLIKEIQPCQRNEDDLVHE